MKNSIKAGLLLALIIFTCKPAMASHIVGGDVTYTYLGDTIVRGVTCHKYQASFSIYEDCQNGQPEAIAQDNPAFLAVYDGTGQPINIYDSVDYSSWQSVPLTAYTSPCGLTVASITDICLIKKTFVKTYALAPNSTGYIICYQRCCRNDAIANIVSPGDVGATYSCSIPASPLINNSAVFKSYPQQIVCLNLPFYCDISATDADGDSLSYGFCSALVGANDANIKPNPPLPPPYAAVSYLSGYSAPLPITGSTDITIDPATGMMTGNPNKKGRFLIAVCCYEWRNGVIIDSITRDFEFIVTDCTGTEYSPTAGYDTTIYAGDSAQFNAAGGMSYSWTPATYLNDASIGDPIGYFPHAGNFTYTLHAVSDSGCTGTGTRTVHVILASRFTAPNAFTPNGDNINDYLKPIAVLNATLLHFKVFNRNGNMVYDGGPGDAGWDGTYKGKKEDTGTFFWEITYKDNNGATRVAKGNSTLIR